MRKTLLRTAAGLGVLALGAFAWMRDPSPVGHWTSAAGRAEFAAAYDRAFADLPRPAATLDVRTEYGFVRAYRFDGADSGEKPLVLLPGTASASPVWADNLPSLLRIGDVWTLDLLGEPGMSVQDRPIRSDDDKARWLDQALAGLPGDRFHLVGLSIGGWTAANLALRRPATVETLTLVEPVQVFGDIPVETAIRSIPAAVGWFPKAWRDGFSSYTAGGAPVEDVPVADMIEAGMRNYAMKQPQPTRLTEAQVRSLPRPTLAIVAGRSVMHDGPAARDLARRVLPPEDVLYYPDATHAINGEQPDRIAADLAAFLARV